MDTRQVAGGLIFKDQKLLLVKNDRPYSKTSDWTTPGGVIAKGETILEGLTREVKEETGIIVSSWEGPIYSVEVNFIDRRFFLDVQAFSAKLWEGELVFEDPDGIVTDALFCGEQEQSDLLGSSPIWVSEPLLEWQKVRDSMSFEYEVKGQSPDDSTVKRCA